MPEFLQTLIDQLTGPTLNLLGALAILIVGWIIALIAGTVVRRVFKRITLDDKVAQWLSKDGTLPVDSAPALPVRMGPVVTVVHHAQEALPHGRDFDFLQGYQALGCHASPIRETGEQGFTVDTPLGQVFDQEGTDTIR